MTEIKILSAFTPSKYLCFLDEGARFAWFPATGRVYLNGSVCGWADSPESAAAQIAAFPPPGTVILMEARK